MRSKNLNVNFVPANESNNFQRLDGMCNDPVSCWCVCDTINDHVPLGFPVR